MITNHKIYLLFSSTSSSVFTWSSEFRLYRKPFLPVVAAVIKLGFWVSETWDEELRVSHFLFHNSEMVVVLLVLVSTVSTLAYKGITPTHAPKIITQAPGRVINMDSTARRKWLTIK